LYILKADKVRNNKQQQQANEGAVLMDEKSNGPPEQMKQKMKQKYENDKQRDFKICQSSTCSMVMTNERQVQTYPVV
jgi:hypothetical protein